MLHMQISKEVRGLVNDPSRVVNKDLLMFQSEGDKL